MRRDRVQSASVVLLIASVAAVAAGGPQRADPRDEPQRFFRKFFGPKDQTQADDARLQPLVDLWRGLMKRHNGPDGFNPRVELLVAASETPLEAIRVAMVEADLESLVEQPPGTLRFSCVDIEGTLPLGFLRALCSDQLEHLSHEQRISLMVNLATTAERVFGSVGGQAQQWLVPEVVGLSTRRTARTSEWELKWRAHMARYLVLNEQLLPELKMMPDFYACAIERVETELARFPAEFQMLRGENAMDRDFRELPPTEWLIWPERALEQP